MKSFEGKHKGKPIFILGCGYTLNYHDLTKIDPYLSIGINRAVYTYHPDYWMFIDHPIVKEFGKQIDLRIIPSQIICWEDARYKDNGAIIFKQSRNRKPEQMNNKYDGLMFGNTTTFTAIHLSHIMGCNPIVLLGVDLCFTDGHGHFYDKEPQPMKHGHFKAKRQSSTKVLQKKGGKEYWTRNDFMRMAQNIDRAHRTLKQQGVKLVHCSTNTILDVVPYQDLDSVLSEL